MVTEQRMYTLIRQLAPIADRQFEIEFFGPGLEVAFAFGCSASAVQTNGDLP
jgi:hypothetical protein